MSAYKNYIQDFPGRCGDLLALQFDDARNNNREVTHLLALATTGLIVPYARLSEKNHPLPDPATEKVKGEFSGFLDSPFLGAALFPTKAPQSFRFGKITDISRDPDSWSGSIESMSNKKQIKSVIRVLRNALAHGNLFTRGESRINELVFLSRVKHDEPDLGYYVLLVRPNEFKQFLEGWFAFLSQLDIPNTEIIETGLFVNAAGF